MKYTKKEILDLIQRIVFKVTQVKIDSEDISLLDTRLHIHPADFLYIFNELEKELGVPVVNLLIDHDYQIMRMDHMSEALLDLLSQN